MSDTRAMIEETLKPVIDINAPYAKRLIDAIEGIYSERVSELLRFNNEFEQRARVAERRDRFQRRVHPWLMETFGAEIAGDKLERAHRFLEEALELVQVSNVTADEAHQIVDYVYGRPQGDINQEAGGVMVTFAALCLANKIDMHEAGEAELARVWTAIDKIRAKHFAKPKFSPLPGR